jgi:hypothetical protein
MKFIMRWLLVTLVLLLATGLSHAVGWADILFWKVGWIAKIFAVPEYVLLLPVIALPITPGSVLNTHWFFMPAIVVSLALWGLLFTWIWSRQASARR